MKKILMVSLGALLLLSLTACAGRSQFDGSSTANDHQVEMAYQVLNSAKAGLFQLEAGDRLAVEVVSQAGTVDIEIAEVDGESIYRGKALPTGGFEVEVPQSGKYQWTVTGRGARGSVSIVRQE